MSQPLFSICIPNYNYANYIGETIQSVLDQTFQDFEIIVADNASTDDSISVVERFKDERIRIIRNRYNIGFAPNLQRASEPARGKFMLMLSSDDRMRPGALATYQQILAELGTSAQYSILFAEAYQIDNRGQMVASGHVRQPDYYRELSCDSQTLPDGREYLRYAGRDVFKAVTRRLCAAGPFLSMLYPRSMFESVEGYNNVHLTDPDTHFTHKLLNLTSQVVWISEKLFEYRVHESNQFSLQKQQASIKKPIDKYLYTLDISEQLLSELGLKRQDIIKAFIYRYCVNESFHYLGRGAYAQAWKGLLFGFTTYPITVLKNPRAYALAALLATGPLSAALTRLTRNTFRGLGGQDE
jgi:glycosyltransferase involved in cell wall biosynthesis